MTTPITLTEEQLNEPMATLTHDDYNVEIKKQQEYIQRLIALYNITMNVVRQEPDFDPDTFAESFNVLPLIYHSIAEIEEKCSEIEDREMLVLDLQRVWALIALTTKVKIPASLAKIDRFVSEAYHLLVKAHNAVDQTKIEIETGSEIGKAMLARAGVVTH